VFAGVYVGWCTTGVNERGCNIRALAFLYELQSLFKASYSSRTSDGQSTAFSPASTIRAVPS
jgi:hypothetical protein